MELTLINQLEDAAWEKQLPLLQLKQLKTVAH